MSEQKKDSSNSENKYFPGCFLIKYDSNWTDGVIWRLDDREALIQKYKAENIGNKQFKKTNSFSGWTKYERENYRVIKTKLVSRNRTEEIVQVIELGEQDDVSSGKKNQFEAAALRKCHVFTKNKEVSDSCSSKDSSSKSVITKRSSATNSEGIVISNVQSLSKPENDSADMEMPSKKKSKIESSLTFKELHLNLENPEVANKTCSVEVQASVSKPKQQLEIAGSHTQNDKDSSLCSPLISDPESKKDNKYDLMTSVIIESNEKVKLSQTTNINENNTLSNGHLKKELHRPVEKMMMQIWPTFFESRDESFEKKSFTAYISLEKLSDKTIQKYLMGEVIAKDTYASVLPKYKVTAKKEVRKESNLQDKSTYCLDESKTVYDRSKLSEEGTNMCSSSDNLDTTSTIYINKSKKKCCEGNDNDDDDVNVNNTFNKRRRIVCITSDSEDSITDNEECYLTNSNPDRIDYKNTNETVSAAIAKTKDENLISPKGDENVISTKADESKDKNVISAKTDDKSKDEDLISTNEISGMINDPTSKVLDDLKNANDNRVKITLRREKLEKEYRQFMNDIKKTHEMYEEKIRILKLEYDDVKLKQNEKNIDFCKRKEECDKELTEVNKEFETLKGKLLDFKPVLNKEDIKNELNDRIVTICPNEPPNSEALVENTKKNLSTEEAVTCRTSEDLKICNNSKNIGISDISNKPLNLPPYKEDPSAFKISVVSEANIANFGGPSCMFNQNDVHLPTTKDSSDINSSHSSNKEPLVQLNLKQAQVCSILKGGTSLLKKSETLISRASDHIPVSSTSTVSRNTVIPQQVSQLFTSQTSLLNTSHPVNLQWHVPDAVSTSQTVMVEKEKILYSYMPNNVVTVSTAPSTVTFQPVALHHNISSKPQIQNTANVSQSIKGAAKSSIAYVQNTPVVLSTSVLAQTAGVQAPLLLPTQQNTAVSNISAIALPLQSIPSSSRTADQEILVQVINLKQNVSQKQIKTKGSASSTSKVCFICGMPGEYMCPCGKISYCGAKCQQLDHTRHSKQCGHC